MRYNYFYLPYREEKGIDYLFLIYLYCVAENDKQVKSVINFASYQELADRINDTLNKRCKVKENKVWIKVDKLRRNLQNIKYSEFFYFDYFCRGCYSIYLFNNLNAFLPNERLTPPFVRLSPHQIDFLLE